MLKSTLYLSLAVVCLAAFHCFGVIAMQSWALDLGSALFPARAHALTILWWTVFGGGAVVAATVGFYHLFSGRELWISENDSEDDRGGRFILATSLLAALLPLLLHNLVFGNGGIADDGSAYLFSAELLASGRLWVESPELKLFFDRAFLVNDGRMFTQYFLGWPALLAPGALIGMPEIVNPLLTALTVPPLFRAARYFAGETAARIATIAFITSPFTISLGATLLSHTSCMCALTWFLWTSLKSRDSDSLWLVAGMTAAFCLAFFIRPLTALGFGAPLLIYWMVSAIRYPNRRLSRLLTFGAVAAAFAALFLLTNLQLTGSAFKPAYQYTLEYARSNGFRFSTWPTEPVTSVAGFRFTGPVDAVARVTGGIVRTNIDSFGWFSTFAVCLLAWRRRLLIAWAIVGSFFVSQLLVGSGGIDTFGPVYFAELLPILSILCGAGLVFGAEVAERLEIEQAKNVLPWAALTALVSTSYLGYGGVRLYNVARVTAATSVPFDLIEEAQISNAVVFAPRPFVHPCRSFPTQHWVFWHPLNDPDLQNDVLWVNHISTDLDRRFMDRMFSERSGYILQWLPSCEAVLIPVKSETAQQVPNGTPLGSGSVDDLIHQFDGTDKTSTN